MKTLTLIFIGMLTLAVAWGMGYRTGALDEGMRNRAEIRALRQDVDSYSDALQKLSDEKVRLLRKLHG